MKLNVLVLYVLSQFKLFVFVFVVALAPVHDLFLDRETVVCPDLALGLVRSVTRKTGECKFSVTLFL